MRKSAVFTGFSGIRASVPGRRFDCKNHSVRTYQTLRSEGRVGRLDVIGLSGRFRRFCDRVELVIWITAGCGCGLDVSVIVQVFGGKDSCA